MIYNDANTDQYNDEQLFESIFQEPQLVKVASTDTTHLLDVQSINSQFKNFIPTDIDQLRLTMSEISSDRVKPSVFW